MDQTRLVQAIRKVQPQATTPLGEFLKIGADRLLEQRQRQRGFGTYRLLVVTDGEATDPHLVERYLPDVLARGITVDVIGVDMRQNHMLATRVHSYRKANDPGAMFTAVSEVLAEVGSRGDDAAQQEDFELLAALPDDMALPLIQALNESGNQPIGQNSANPPPAAQAKSETTAPVAARGFLAVLTGMACFGMLPCVVIAAVLGMVFFKVIQRS